MKIQNMTTKTLLILLAVAALSLTGCNGVETEETAHQSPQTQKSNIQESPSDTNGFQTDVKAANTANTGTTDNSAAQGNDTTNPKIVSKISEEDKQRFLDAVNAARADTQDCGDQGVFQPAPALNWNDKLSNAAYEHSDDMAKSNTFAHEGSGSASDVTAQDENLGRGSNFRERIEHNGYTQWRTIGENIAAGYSNAQDVVDAWLKSPHHCANLMNPKFSEVGMALVTQDGSDYYTYWSQEFGGQ